MSEQRQKEIQDIAERGTTALANLSDLRQRAGLPVISSTDSNFELHKAISQMKSNLFLPTTGEITKTALVKLFAATIASYVNPQGTGYAELTRNFLGELTDSSTSRTITKNIKALEDCGLFGVITGSGGSRTRFYPLIHPKSLAKFEKVIADAQAGIHPQFKAIDAVDTLEGDEPEALVFGKPTDAPF